MNQRSVDLQSATINMSLFNLRNNNRGWIMTYFDENSQLEQDFRRYLRGTRRMKETSAIGVMRRLPKGWMEWPIERLEEYYFKVLDDPDLTSISKRHIYYSIKHLCDFKGVKWDYRPPKYHLRRRQSVEPEQIFALLDSITDPRHMALILTHIYTGFRPGELVNLKIQDVDFDKSEIVVKDTKTYHDRILPLHKKPAMAIRRYLSTRKDNNPYLFYSIMEDGPLTTHGYRALLKRLCIKAGIKPFTPYNLRHFFGTQFIENGGDVMILKEILGHSNIMTTASVYVHSNPRMIRKGYEKACPEF